MNLFVGVDLAWGHRRSSGVALLAEERECLQEVTPTTTLSTIEHICEAIARWDHGATLVIAVDAPLVVPNLTGERPVESQMRQRFACYHAACHPANRRLLGDPPRGEQLWRQLSRCLGVQLMTAPPVCQPCRVVFEVYPHAALVKLFNLPRILEYKARRGRSLGYRLEQMQTYLHRLAQLSEPRLTLPNWTTCLPHTGVELKTFEDKVDALFCAWLAARAWLRGGEVLGEAENGSIWLP